MKVIVFPSLAVLLPLAGGDVAVVERDLHASFDFLQQDLQARIGAALREVARPPGLEDAPVRLQLKGRTLDIAIPGSEPAAYLRVDLGF